MWNLYAEDGIGNAVVMHFDSLDEASLMVDTLRMEGFVKADITLESEHKNPA